MSRPKVYLETTVPSYLTARPSRDLVTTAHQQVTREWWDQRREDFRLFVSDLVVEEAGRGDPEAATRRLELLEPFPVLETNEAARDLARFFLAEGTIPREELADAVHIAVAIIHGIDFLLTWNLKHIAKAEVRQRIERLSRAEGYEPPTICTPEELL